MNRADAYWAINACLPHVGITKGNSLGITQQNGIAHFYATDDYTMGIARIDAEMRLDIHISKAEATDLMRFIRPSRKAHEAEMLEVACAQTAQGDTELHIATEDDSAVFQVAESQVTLSYLLDFTSRISASPVEPGELIVQPKLVEKFAKAQRFDADRMRIYPHASYERWGVALVTVGEHFLGGVAGLTYDDNPDATLWSFIERKEKAA